MAYAIVLGYLIGIILTGLLVVWVVAAWLQGKEIRKHKNKFEKEIEDETKH